MPRYAIVLVLIVGLALGAHSARGQGWKLVANVDPDVGRNGEFSSIAADSNLVTHILSYNGAPGDLRHEWLDGTGWHNEAVDTAGDVGRYCSATVDRYDRPCVAYADATNQTLKFARLGDRGWMIETVPGISTECGYISLALDSTGFPHISFHDLMNLNLVYVAQSRDGWRSEVVDEGPNCGGYCSLALDARDGAHIAYHDSVNRALKYAWNEEGRWLTRTVVDKNVDGDISMDLDRNDYPVIAYCEATERGGNLVCIREARSGWRSRAVDAGDSLRVYTSLRVDHDGGVHISYTDVGTGSLKIAEWDREGWHCVYAGGTSWFTAVASSLCVDLKGCVRISCFSDPMLCYLTNFNRPPTRPTLTLTPEHPGPGEPITATVTGCTDPDLDTVDYFYKWAVLADGNWDTRADRRTVEATHVLPAGTTHRGETWRCLLRAFDGIEYTEVVEAQVTVE